MCINPQIVYIGPKGDKTAQETACHECWQCIENAVDDWVGRNIAETKTSVAAHAVTLTYGRDRDGLVDHEKATVLTYRDVQNYLKLLRFHDFPVRYFVTGEFGSTKGRAHWHIMLYWQEVSPTDRAEATEELRRRWFPGGTAWRTDPTSRRWVSKEWAPGAIPLDWNFNDDAHWPHGFSFWTSPGPQAVRYNCKYIQKGMGDAQRQGHLAMSKKPPLGAAYFERLARDYVAQGIAPQSLEYSFPEVTRINSRTGVSEPVKFHLRDRSAQLFLEQYLSAYEAANPGKDYLASELDLFQFRDAEARYVLEAQRKPDRAFHALRSKVRDRIAHELALMIEQPVLGSHIEVEAGHFYYSLPENRESETTTRLAARWEYDTVTRLWRRMHWTKGKGWK